MSAFAMHSICLPMKQTLNQEVRKKITKNIFNPSIELGEFAYSSRNAMYLLSRGNGSKRGKERKFKKATLNLRNCPVG